MPATAGSNARTASTSAAIAAWNASAETVPSVPGIRDRRRCENTGPSGVNRTAATRRFVPPASTTTTGAEVAGTTDEKERHESIIRRDDGAPAIAASASLSNARITASRSSRVGAKPLSFRNSWIIPFMSNRQSITSCRW